MVSRSSERGYVALIAVLITAAIATAAALAILDTATYKNKELQVQQDAVRARSLASGCVEEALQVVYSTTAYTGSGTFSLSGNSCTYSVTSTGANTRTILAVAVVGNTTKKLQASVTIGSTTISVSSWQEVT